VVKIAIWHNLPSGGGKRALHDHVRGLLERGHTLEAWCPDSADQSYLPLADLIPEHRLPLGTQLARGPLARLARPYREIADRLAALDRHCRECAAAINAGGFDLLFANSCQFVRAAPIGRYVQLPKVLYLQEPYRWLYEALPRLPWAALPPAGPGWWRPANLRARLRDALRVHGLRLQAREEQASAAAFDTILGNSRYSRESVLRAYGLDAKVCYLGIDTAQFARRDVPKENLVVGIGAFVREKNVHFAIEALAMVAPPRPRLVWIGNVAVPSYLDWLTRLAHDRGVAFEPRMRVSDDELRDTLSRALALVYAPRLEPFGLAPLEANACGLPALAVAEGGVRETVEDGVNGILVEPEPPAMARAIERLRDDPALAQRLGANAYQIVRERWSLPAAIDRLETRFAETIDQTAKTPRAPK
jgi:glycosyltransferase involved in cell wall biosynthesis